MKIRIFQSDKGDCLLLTSKGGTHRVLVDGGMGASFTAHVAPELEKLAKAKKALDAVYVSHIDDDHIAGVLKLVDAMVDWRVFDFKKKKANGAAVKKPTLPRPPEIKKIWHNAFHEQLEDNAGAIDEMIAASSAILAASRKLSAKRLFDHTSGIAVSKAQALKLVRRVGADQLDIAVNPEFDHKLMVIKKNSPELKIGSMEFLLLGPFQQDLEKLRDEWNDWLEAHQKEVEEIRRKAQADEDRLTSDVDRLLAPLSVQADAFVDFELALAKKLGKRSEVTTPNLASLMFLAREDNQTVLLTGDGHADDVIAGLKQHKLLDPAGKLHVNVLKVQHHGSEHNMTEAFARDITADDYIFCGNGFSGNPEIDVIDVLARERRKALPNKPFTFWFNSTEKVAPEANRAHMANVKKRVDHHIAMSNKKMSARWIKGSFIDLS